MIDAYANGNVPADNDHLGWSRLVTEVCVSLTSLLSASRFKCIFHVECFFQMFTGLLFDSNMIRDVQWFVTIILKISVSMFEAQKNRK